MIRALTVRGQQGRIRVGYQTAATLGPFSLTPVGPNQWEVQASVTQTDAFWLSQSPRTLELSVGQQRWRWPASGLVIGGGTISGVVSGRPERR